MHGAGWLLLHPFDRWSLKLQSYAKAPVGQPLTINNSAHSSQIPYSRANHQAFLRLSRPLHQDAYP